MIFLTEKILKIDQSLTKLRLIIIEKVSEGYFFDSPGIFQMYSVHCSLDQYVYVCKGKDEGRRHLIFTPCLQQIPQTFYAWI